MAETQAHEHGPGTTQGNRETLNLYLVTVADLWGGRGKIIRFCFDRGKIDLMLLK